MGRPSSIDRAKETALWRKRLFLGLGAVALGLAVGLACLAPAAGRAGAAYLYMVRFRPWEPLDPPANPLEWTVLEQRLRAFEAGDTSEVTLSAGDLNQLARRLARGEAAACRVRLPERDGDDLRLELSLPWFQKPAKGGKAARSRYLNLWMHLAARTDPQGLSLQVHDAGYQDQEASPLLAQRLQAGFGRLVAEDHRLPWTKIARKITHVKLEGDGLVLRHLR